MPLKFTDLNSRLALVVNCDKNIKKWKANVKFVRSYVKVANKAIKTRQKVRQTSTP